jgi:hypothetical protein
MKWILSSRALGATTLVTLGLLFATSNAQADTYSVGFTCDVGACLYLPTAPNVTFPAPTTLDITLDTLSWSFTLASPDQPTDAYRWIFNVGNCPSAGICYNQVQVLDNTTGLYPLDVELGPVPLDTFPQFTQYQGNIDFSAVTTPEPITLSLFGAGLLGLGALRRRKARKEI